MQLAGFLPAAFVVEGGSKMDEWNLFIACASFFL